MKTLAATFMAKLLVDTVGGFHPLQGRTFLPFPGRYLATFLLWSLLGIAAGFGPRASRLAGRLAAVVLLTALVLGPAGPTFVGWLEGVTRNLPTEEAQTP